MLCIMNVFALYMIILSFVPHYCCSSLERMFVLLIDVVSCVVWFTKSSHNDSLSLPQAESGMARTKLINLLKRFLSELHFC